MTDSKRMTPFQMPIIPAFAQSEVETLRTGIASGYSVKEMAGMLGKHEKTLRRYNRVFEMYGIHAFAKG